MGDNSYRREFALLGADSLLPAQTPFVEGFIIWWGNQEVTKFNSFYENGGERWMCTHAPQLVLMG